MNILVVDDDQFIRELLQTMLEKEGIETHLCGSVPEAVAALDQDRHFDMVITDIIMPGQDGAQLMQHIKETMPSLPVIAITGGIENATADYVHYADMFADKTLAKPFKKQELIDTINGLAA